MTFARVCNLGVFAVRSNLRLRITRVGVAAGLAILLLGPTLSLATGRGWRLDDALAFYGLAVTMLFGLRSGLALQREGSLELFLAHNFVTHVEHAAGMALSLLLAWLLILGGTFLALAAVGGDPGLALWNTAAWGLRSAVPLGFVLIVERVATIRLPFVLPVFGYVLTVVFATVAIGEEQALTLFVMTDRSDPSTLGPLAGQAAILLPATLGGFLVAAWLRDRRAGTRQDVPSYHGSAPNTG